MTRGELAKKQVTRRKVCAAAFLGAAFVSYVWVVSGCCK